MKFEEKIIILRKQNYLSQEQLAEKLNVTRQTISKWELGQSKPDMEKLTDMSKLFNVNIEMLTNDQLKLGQNNSPKKKDGGNRKLVLYILIIILVMAIVTLVIRLAIDKKENKNNIFNKFGEIFDIGNYSKTEFNSKFEFKTGTQSGFFLSSLIDDVITSNKKNKDQKIEVIFLNENYGTDANKVLTIKSKIKDSTNYEITLDYDTDGYINKITISKASGSSFDISVFNMKFETYTGTQTSFFLKSLIDTIVTSNKKNNEHQIEVIFLGKTYGTDTSSIAMIKNELQDSLKYEVTLDYDTDGYGNKVTIEKGM